MYRLNLATWRCIKRKCFFHHKIITSIWTNRHRSFNSTGTLNEKFDAGSDGFKTTRACWATRTRTNWADWNKSRPHWEMIPCSWCPQWERASRSSRAQKRTSGRHCEEKERRRKAGEECRSWDSTQNGNKKASTATVPIAAERCHHHVRGVQRVDEVWWESILLLNCVRLPEKGQQSPNVGTDVGSCKNEKRTSVGPSRI